MLSNGHSPPLSLQHLNNKPVFAYASYYTANDVALAEVIHRHACLTSEQLYALIKSGPLNGRVSKSRVSALIKHGFLDRYRIIYPDDMSICYYTVGHQSRFPAPSLDPHMAESLLVTNRFLLSRCHGNGTLRYKVLREFPVTAVIHTPRHTYTCVRPSGATTPDIPDAERVIALLRDRSITADIDKVFAVPVRYVFDDFPDLFWRFEPETRQLHEADVSFS